MVSLNHTYPSCVLRRPLCWPPLKHTAFDRRGHMAPKRMSKRSLPKISHRVKNQPLSLSIPAPGLKTSPTSRPPNLPQTRSLARKHLTPQTFSQIPQGSSGLKGSKCRNLIQKPLVVDLRNNGPTKNLMWELPKMRGASCGPQTEASLIQGLQNETPFYRNCHIRPKASLSGSEVEGVLLVLLLSLVWDWRTVMFQLSDCSTRGPPDHINIRILHSGPKTQYRGYQKPWLVGSLCLCGLWGSYLYPACICLTPETLGSLPVGRCSAPVSPTWLGLRDPKPSARVLQGPL